MHSSSLWLTVYFYWAAVLWGLKEVTHPRVMTHLLLPEKLFFALSPPCSFSSLLPCYLFWSSLPCFPLVFSLSLLEIWNKEKGEGDEREKEDDEARSGLWFWIFILYTDVHPSSKLARENWKGGNHDFQQLLLLFSEADIFNHHTSLVVV